MDERHALFVDGDEEVFRVVGVCGLLHLKEGGTKSGPSEYNLQKGDLSFLWAHTCGNG